MKPRTVIALGTTLSVSCLITAWLLLDRLQNTREIQAGLRTELQRLTTELDEARTRLADTESKAARLRLTIRSPVATSEPPDSSASAPRNTTLARLRDDPALGILRSRIARTTRAMTYGPLLEKLALSPEQRDAFLDILGEAEDNTADVSQATDKEGVRLQDPAVVELLRTIHQEKEQTLRSLLGDEGYSEYTDYSRSAGVREIAAGLAGAATMAGASLTGEQIEQVVEALAQSCPGYAEGGTAITSRIDWGLAQPVLQSVLSPEQYEVCMSTEVRGARGGGSRFLAAVHAAIDTAMAADEAAMANGGP